MKRNNDNTFEEMGWDEVIPLVSQKLLNTPGEQISAIIGDFVDVESVTALKDLFNRLDCDNFEIRSNNLKLSSDFRSNYIMNSRISGIEECDLLLLIGTNPKYEAPVLNSRILKSTRKNNLKVAVIGTPNDLTYEYMHLGSSTDILSQISSGSHPFADRLKKA